MSKIEAPAPPYVGPPTWAGDSNNKPINRIVIHCTVGQEPGVKGAARATVAMSKRTSRPSSYHYIVDARETLQYVFDSVVAFHAPPNQHSLGVELACSLASEGRGHWERTDHEAMLQRAASLVAQLALAYDVPITKLSASDLKAGKRGICGHADVRDAWHQTSHWDPGPYFPWSVFLGMVRAEADKLRDAPPTPPKPPAPVVPNLRLRDGGLAHVVKGVPYFLLNSIRGLRAAAQARKTRIDLDLQITSDGVVVNTHWPRPLMPHGPGGQDVFVDPLGQIRRERSIASMTWAEVSRLRSTAGNYQINRLDVMLAEAGRQKVGVVLEPKTADARFRDVELWRSIVRQAKAAGVPSVSGYALPANKAAVPAMKAAGIKARVL